MSNYNTINELEIKERFAEAGYGRLFAHSSKRFNAMIDARTKAKYIRELNPDTIEQTQNGIVYAGPTVFFRPDINIKHYQIDKLDIKSAYLAYLINDHIKKPGIFRIKHHGAYRHSDKVVLYIVKFKCHVSNLFVKWFLNSSAIHKKKFRTNGETVSGEIGIFSSTWMNNMKHVSRFLTIDEAVVLRSYTFHGKDTVPVSKSQIDKLYRLKELGAKEAKKMLVQSTGWLSIIDKPTYYHMIQYIKFWLLETTYGNELEDDVFGVQTDCLFYRVTEKNKKVFEMLTDKNVWNLGQKQTSIGTYKHQRVEYDDVIVGKARVVLKDA